MLCVNVVQDKPNKNFLPDLEIAESGGLLHTRSQWRILSKLTASKKVRICQITEKGGIGVN